MLRHTASAELTERGDNVPVRVNWDRTPVSVHHDSKDVLEALILHLKNIHGIRKRSLVMQDREEGGFLFFLYQPCNPRWILEYEYQSDVQEEE
jgi:hypothetical protein